MKKYQGVLGVGLTALSLSIAAGQAPFTAGNLITVQIGDGTTALAATATPLFLVELNPVSGAIVQTIPLPVTPTGLNKACTTRGTSTAAAHLTRSPDGKYIFTVGFDAAVGAADPTAATSATVARVIARIDSAGAIDTTTALSDAYNTSDIRAAITTNGTDLWMSGNTGTAGTGGARYATLGSTTSLQLAATPTNLRMIGIHNGQLYVSSATGTYQGVSAVGTGLPTTAGQTITLLSGFPILAGPSAYDFWYADDNTLYIADDATLLNGGGLQKWTQSAGTWTKAYTFATGAAAGSGCRGLAGQTNAGVNTIWVTSSVNGTSSVGNTVLSVVDTGAAATFTTVATAPVAGTYRGLAWAPIAGGPAPCYANCDGSSVPPVLNSLDFGCFLTKFAQGDTYANCDGSTVPPTLNSLDFGCFLTKFAAGCT